MYFGRNSSRAAFSRRNVIAGGALSFAALFGVTRAKAQSGKVSQSAAGYQSRPNNDQSCGACAHFLAPSSCEYVDGAISPQGWCKFFARKG